MLDDNDWKNLRALCATKDDLRKLEERIEENAAKRQSELFDLLDGLAKNIRDNEEFRLVMSHQMDEVRDRLDALES